VAARAKVIPDDEVEAFLRAAVAGISIGTRPDDLQYLVLEQVARRVFGTDLDVRALVPLPADAAAALLPDPEVRRRLVQLIVVLELLEHPLEPRLAHHVCGYAGKLGVSEPMVAAGRHIADGHLALMYADIQRNSYYTEEMRREVLHGHFWRLLRSKFAYSAVVGDRHIARRWRALGDLPAGSWGRTTFDFYQVHGFPLPGERHGIGEIGAHHDFVHVLADYPATPEGEIDVFAFIAASMDDPKGFTQLVMTLGLFQNASIQHVAGKRVAIARADTLAEPGAAAHFADAMHRGSVCTVDALGADHFALAPEPLDEVRARFEIPPKADPGAPGALDVGSARAPAT
jgi:hypothetical protein